MKLCEMNVREMAKALCEMAMPMSRIATDEELVGVIKRLAERMKEYPKMSMLEKYGVLLEAVPVLLEKHYTDTIMIAAAMMVKSFEETETMNAMEMIREMIVSIDDEFMRFFRSSASMEETNMDADE